MKPSIPCSGRDFGRSQRSLPSPISNPQPHVQFHKLAMYMNLHQKGKPESRCGSAVLQHRRCEWVKGPGGSEWKIWLRLRAEENSAVFRSTRKYSATLGGAQRHSGGTRGRAEVEAPASALSMRELGQTSGDPAGALGYRLWLETERNNPSVAGWEDPVTPLLKWSAIQCHTVKGGHHSTSLKNRNRPHTNHRLHKRSSESFIFLPASQRCLFFFFFWCMDCHLDYNTAN